MEEERAEIQTPAPKGIKRLKLVELERTESAHLQEDLGSSFTELEETDENYCSEFTFPETVDLSKFDKVGNQSTVDEIMEILGGEKTQVKRDNLNCAEVSTGGQGPRLLTNKGNLKGLYGYNKGVETHLYPEEALLLLETGKLELVLGNVPLSVERARCLLLHSNTSTGESSFLSSSIDNYSVYKHFAKLGYRLRRNPGQTSTDGVSVHSYEDEDISMEVEEEVAGCSVRGKKRPRSPIDDIDQSLSSEGGRGLCEEEENEIEFLGSVEGEKMEEVEMMEEEKELPSYFVSENDSDVEILEEVIYSGVVIQELREEEESPYEAGPSTSTANEVLVDLVSSDSEEEKLSYEPIWRNCVPGANLLLSFPPPALIPLNIHSRPSSYLAHFSLTCESNEEVDIERIVDSLHLDNSPKTGSGEGCKSWKEWRESHLEEAKGALKESLLGQSEDATLPGKRKLYQWKTASQRTTEKRNLQVNYNLYPHNTGNLPKNKLGLLVKPTHHVAIVRETDVVPDLNEFPSGEDETPFLVTVLGEDSNVLFLNTNGIPLPF